MLKFVLCASACASAWAWGGLAFGADTADTPSTAVAEVVVTAEFRVQSIQTSSLAISVHSSQQIVDAGVVQTRDITKLEPGVQIGQGGPATQIYVRGVGDFGSTPITNPAVATNIDGVYVSRANSIEGNFYDLQRIEVLKGPQGTLYGRNASGGAINVLTTPPQLDSFSAHLETEIGDYSLVRSEGDLNLPVNSTLAARVSFQVVSRNGYSDQGFDDDHEQSVRVSTLWKPSDNFSLRLTGDYEHVGGLGPAYVLKGVAPPVAALAQADGLPIPSNPRLVLTDPATFSAFDAAVVTGGVCLPSGVIPAKSTTHAGTLTGPQGLCPAGFFAGLGPPSLSSAHQDNNDANFTAEMNWNLGFATLTVIPAYRYVENEYVTFPLITYSSYAPGQPERSDTYSVEARLGNTSRKLTWVAGVYVYGENQRTAAEVPGVEPLGAISGPTYAAANITTRSEAVFGQTTFSLTDRWRLIAGARYASDRKTINGFGEVFDTPLSLPYAIGSVCFGKASPCENGLYTGARTWNSFTYKVGTEFDLTEQNMLYLTYATGEKAGGFNQSTLGGFPSDTNALPYNPEKLGALEFGSRNRFLDSRIVANFEGFYWKYSNAQESFAYESNGSPAFGTTNAASATMYGLDVSITARLTTRDTLTFGGEYLHSRFDKFIYQSSGLTPLTTGCAITAAPPLQNINCTGMPLIRAPQWSGTASYTHFFELENGGQIDATLSAQFASSRYLGTDYTPQTLADSYAEGDFLVTYHSPDKKWSLTGYVRNFNNALVYTGSFTIPQLTPSLTVGNLAPPRTYGMRLAVDF